ncbi:MAG: NAD-dependent DNA ligase LigA [Agathobacter sp.]|nr:NAD-dependent DNA ligase LigA [Agathobacter sp.]
MSDLNIEKKQQIEALVEQLNKASKVYYNGQDEIMSNYEWDAMFDELAVLEAETGYVLENSPTQNVGYESASGKKEQHEFAPLSLAKTKSVEELKKWAGVYPIWLSWKLDGCTLVLTYDNGKLTKILTRGSGNMGTNITHLKNSIKGFPLEIPYNGHFVVRGEAVISYSDFALINDMIEDEDEKYANPRNLASGTLNLDDAEEVKNRHVHFHAFTLVYMDEPMVSWGERMNYLEELKFTVVDRELGDADTIADLVEKWTKRVESGKMDLPVDGLVICYDDTEYAATGSVTGHHATRAGYAFKWQDESVESRLRYIEWSCAVSTISPVAVFEPVQIEGTTVSRASLCNLSEIERLGVGKECTLEVIKANKIIPKCIAVKDAVGEVEIPTECPVCRAATKIHISASGTKTLYCTNVDCTAKNVQKFSRFVSKNAMDIEGLSVQTMLTFINEGFIKEYADIYRLSEHFETISQLEGFGEKSCENMNKAIEKSRNIHPVNLIFALCIPMIGLDAAKKIVNTVGFDDFLKRMEEGIGFEDIDGIGGEKSNSILQWYADENNQRILKNLLEVIHVQKVEKINTENGRCKGLTFVITGDVHHFKNRDAFKAYVEAEGGKVAGSVSGKTSYLVNNDVESTSSKNKKAKSLNVPIISEDTFVERFGGLNAN